jgi:hypothetical protein
MFGQVAELCVVDGVVVDGVVLVAAGVVLVAAGVVVVLEELPDAAFAIAALPPAMAAVATRLAKIVGSRLCM